MYVCTELAMQSTTCHLTVSPLLWLTLLRTLTGKATAISAHAPTLNADQETKAMFWL